MNENTLNCGASSHATNIAGYQPLLLTGGLKGSIEYIVHPAESMVEIGTNDPKAKYQELGAAGVPPRPFLAPALFEVMGDMQTEIPALIASAIIGETK
jgi:hypothetical protein